MPTTKPMRYAHSDGQTDVCFDSEGKYMLTCGSDGDVRIWEGIDDDDAISHRVGDKAFALAYKNQRFFIATDTNNIQAYTFPDCCPDGILTRFTAPANHIIVSSKTSTLVAGASDFAIKVVDEDSKSHKTLHGHEAPILSLALDPTDTYLASSSCDGSVRILQMSDHSLVHSWSSLLPKCNDVSLSKTVCRMCWAAKGGELLYVPAEKEIQVYERGSWKKVATITDPCFSEHVSVLALSPDGQYLAAGASDGWICVFSTKTKTCVDKHKNEKGISITSMAWNPKDNMELAFCDNQGQLGVLNDIKTKAEQSSRTSSENQVPRGVFDDEDDDFLLEATNDKPADSMDDDDTISQAKALRPLLSDDDDDPGALPDMKMPMSDLDDDNSSVTSDKPIVVKPDVRYEGFKPTPLQRAFQPGSTPEHLSNRFMVWNLVGIVRQYNTDEENSVDIEFHDSAVHHAMHISNNHNYTMADISTEAVVLASERDDEAASKLTCMHFAAWDNNKEWSISMPEEEEIQATTLGDGWVAVATDARNIRLFTVAGVQKEVFSIPGPVVCLAAHSSQLLVVYHRGMGVPGDQCLGVSLLDVKDWRREVKDEPLPLTAKSTVSWVGFSAEGTAFYMDSAGIVRMLNRNAGRTWVQVANTRNVAKGKSDHFWIVGISENPQQLRCIPCKGSRYPPTLPRPAMTILPFKVPLCDLASEKSQYEELLWRTRLLTGHFDHWSRLGFEFDETVKAEVQKPAQEALMKLFALSARSEREYRALEVCEMMPDQHTLQLAIKYSSRMRYLQLAQRISELAVRKQEEELASQGQAASYEEEDDVIPQRSGTHHAAESYQSQDEEVEVQEDGNQDVEDMDESDTTAPGPMLALKQKEVKSSKPAVTNVPRGNPFKVSSQTSHSGIAKGTQVFDSMSKKKSVDRSLSVSEPKLTKISKTTQKKISQPKLFLEKSKSEDATSRVAQTKVTTPHKAPTAFDLWLEENKGTIEEKHLETPEEDFNKFATEQFRLLAKEERQEWLKKAKSFSQKSKENTVSGGDSGDGSENKKRKREECNGDDDSEESVKKLKDRDISKQELKKQPLTQTTNSKLANFAFQKE